MNQDSLSRNIAPLPIRRRWPLIVPLLLLHGIGAFGLIPWLLTLFALVVSDNLGSIEARYPIFKLLEILALIYPILPVIAALATLTLFLFRKDLATIVISVLALLMGAAFFVAFWAGPWMKPL